jgi:hypothetical protein
MEYIKLIAIEIGDLYSSIFFEDNYCLSDLDTVKHQKRELEENGYICLMTKVVSEITLE